MNAKKAELTFIKYAKRKGYKYKVVGDYVYRKWKTKTEPMIRMLGAKNNKVQVLETGVGQYEIGESMNKIGLLPCAGSGLADKCPVVKQVEQLSQQLKEGQFTKFEEVVTKVDRWIRSQPMNIINSYDIIKETYRIIVGNKTQKNYSKKINKNA